MNTTREVAKLKRRENSLKKIKQSKKSKNSIQNSLDSNAILEKIRKRKQELRTRQLNTSVRKSSQPRTNSSGRVRSSDHENKLSYVYQHKLKKHKNIKHSKSRSKKRPLRRKKRRSKKKSKSRRNVQKQEVPPFSDNFTDLRINPKGKAKKKDGSLELFDQSFGNPSSKDDPLNRSKDLQFDLSPGKSSQMTKNEELYCDHAEHQQKVERIKQKEEANLHKMQNEKHTNKKSQFMCKYYVPIHKRVHSEIKHRQAKLDKLQQSVWQERKNKEKMESDELFFPRTKLSYELQRKRRSINIIHEKNQDLYHNYSLQTSHQSFMNFLKDHEAWDYRRQKKIEEEKTKKEQKILEELTFTPSINQNSYKLLPKRNESVEERLMMRAAKSQAKLESMRLAQEFSFQPNIYKGSKEGKCILSLKKSDHNCSRTGNSEIPPLPPRDPVGVTKVKLQYKENEKVIKHNTETEKSKIREFSPVLETSQRDYATLDEHSA
ncbi:unnamed protein product [Moneuplotes crassus]|uniref:Uncharacterized protein n=1 Tax=Euplotes crassus TaxID=5936 RepID=A0AAD1X9I5_EUPCR|nr:unnamed protein product [Moneuplotes crassus]